MTDEEDELTEPLVGLCSNPVHLMTEEEKRLRVVHLHQMRQSFQTFKSEMERAAKTPVAKRVKEKVDLSELEDLL